MWSHTCILGTEVSWRVCSNTGNLLLVATNGFLEEQVADKLASKSSSESQSLLGCSGVGHCSEMSLKANYQLENGMQDFTLEKQAD